MAVKENRLKKEPAKEAEKEKKTTRKDPDKPKRSFLQGLQNVFVNISGLYQDERFRKIMGLLFLLISIGLCIAFTSFLFSWKIDQDKVEGSLLSVLSINGKVENRWGSIGAWISHIFIYKWFGITSYVFSFLFFISGVRILFQVSLLPLKKVFSSAFFLIPFLSITISYVLNLFHQTELLVLGGGFGLHATIYMERWLSHAGTGFLLLFAILSYLVIAFNIPFTRQVLSVEENIPDQLIEEGSIEENVLRTDSLLPDKSEFFDNPLLEVEAVITTEEAKVPEFENKADELELTIENFFDKEVSGAQPLIADNNVPLDFETIINIDEVAHPDDLQENKMPEGEYDPTLELSAYQFPTLDLLQDYGSSKIQVTKEELEENKNKIVATLGHYDIGIEKIKATIGPTVTLYEIVPAPGVRISKIKNLEDDIALSLAALGIRIIAPIPGKGTIGIEVPNQKPETVSMKTILASEKFQSSEMELPIGIGKTISNEVFIADLAKMPHLLMAGATGQGKSVGLNAVLVSLLYKKHPSQVKFVLVDPKKVELTLFKKIERHFLAMLPGEEEAIISDTTKVVHTLNSLCIEMDQRYDLLKDAEVRNIKEYNTKFIARKLLPTKGHRFLPYIILVVDEFADLIMTAGKEVEMPIARLAQLARAIGIHLIIATQRPSVNIITGTIKANFPARLAFRVTAKVDSRTILDAGGADQLIGRGDMLLSTGAELIRLQCAFVDTPEVEKITEFIGSQRGYASPYMLPEYVDEKAEIQGEMDHSERDSMFEEAARIIVQHQQGSTSLIQRRLKLGYNRAGRIIDQLEKAGILGHFEGSKAREVLIKDPMSLEMILKSNKEEI